ncbi:hypothetical protein Rsub_06088 [Raphidocelis subcapitata]|uniref:Uncharacterized protein n=1 Tax=Raphidocelis subcapitata TaxID=307507 RepID=A0A2V0P1L0_9CHLO|nr:hypothetical protein Rsub_06088 [Raphidocelis subcapitata]|eukprot:GBF93756.1 hypothetical protein Rsub_06088 [Raphidocelis subcapitata]
MQGRRRHSSSGGDSSSGDSGDSSSSSATSSEDDAQSSSGCAMPAGALAPIRAWRDRRQRAAGALRACFRGWLWSARAAGQGRADAAADALCAARTARIFAAWRRHARVRRGLYDRAHGGPRVRMPPGLAAEVLRRDGKGGLAAAHFAHGTATRALRSWMAAAVCAHQPPPG